MKIIVSVEVFILEDFIIFLLKTFSYSLSTL